MRKVLALGAAAAALTLAVATAATAGNGTPINQGSANTLTLAVYGDAPYAPDNIDRSAFDATPAFINAVNHDPKVDLVAQVGDIHSGSQRCTLAYDQSIANLWTAFADPFVYTPGDNEWSDCQKKKQIGTDDASVNHDLSYAGGDPIANLALVRQLFFPNSGYTIGGRPKQVVSQAQVGSGTDANYVENVMWEQSKTLFFTLNIPGGSNNDTDVWWKDYGKTLTAAQTAEVTERSQADLHWIKAAFDQAEADGVDGVVILTQADMWDTADTLVGHQSGYEQFISAIASRTTQYGGPVLFFNGDSHMFRSDNPLVPHSQCIIETGQSDTSTKACAAKDNAYNQHPGYNVPNFHRIIVHGGTTFPAQPLEYTRLTDDPRVSAPNGLWAFGPFSWERVQP